VEHAGADHLRDVVEFSPTGRDRQRCRHVRVFPGGGDEAESTVAPATCDTLKVTFTPSLATDYTKQTATVCLVVNP